MDVKRITRVRPHLHRISVDGGLSLWHRFVVTVAAAALIAGGVLDPVLTSAILAVGLIFFSFVILTVKSAVSMVSDRGMRQVEALLADPDCPHYTVLLPAYHEASILHELVDQVRKLDYPADRLHVVLLLEEGDQDTIDREAWLRRRGMIPSYVTTLIVPYPEAAPGVGVLRRLFRLLTFPLHPRHKRRPSEHPAPGPIGKPRALMYAVSQGLVYGSAASGAQDPDSLLVVYDAEDRPDPDQLRKAASIFATAPPRLACLQAVLMWHNATGGILERMLAGQYAWTFSMIDPGLAATNGVVPLGGTSNHFKVEALDQVGYWDSSNVTEDLDLGVKLRRAHRRVAMLPSTTYEEATSSIGAQIKQASRWIKGHPATAISHSRNPFRLVWDLGPWGTLSFIVVVLGTQPAVVAGPLFWAMTVCYIITGAAIIQEITPAPAFYIGSVCLLANIYFVFMFMLACMKTRQYNLVPWMLLLPIYWATISFIAGLKATWELATGNFYYWAKTSHGTGVSRRAEVTRGDLDELGLTSSRRVS